MGRRGPQPGDQAGRHVGWSRPGHSAPWRIVARGRTWRETWAALIAATKDDRDGDKLILTEGQSPEQVPGCGIDGG
jgi:hypothetical protein